MIASFGRRVGEPEAPETGFEEIVAVLAFTFITLLRGGLPGSQGQLSDVNQTVESHQPLPAHQQLSSGFELRRKVRTLLESPRLNAADNFCAVSSSRAPKQGTNIAAQTNRASKWSVPVTARTRSCERTPLTSTLGGHSPPHP